MNCPKCKTTNLLRKSYESPYKCPNCKGMWLENSKIPKFMKENSLSANEESMETRNDDKTGLCPEGHGIMIRARIDTKEPFHLEKCSKCGGVWFDNGEWQKIVKKNLTDQLAIFWCKSWQTQQRKQRGKKKYHEINRQLLGEDVFNQIMQLSEALQKHPEKGRAIALLQQEIE